MQRDQVPIWKGGSYRQLQSKKTFRGLSVAQSPGFVIREVKCLLSAHTAGSRQLRKRESSFHSLIHHPSLSFQTKPRKTRDRKGWGGPGLGQWVTPAVPSIGTGRRPGSGPGSSPRASPEVLPVGGLPGEAARQRGPGGSTLVLNSEEGDGWGREREIFI